MANQQRFSGILIQQIVGSSLAELSGFQAEDVVREVNGHKIHSQTEIFKQLDLSFQLGYLCNQSIYHRKFNKCSTF